MTSLSKILLAAMLLACSLSVPAQTELHTPGTHSVLYLGPGQHQPLIVGLGGSEGGNAWAGRHWDSIRGQFIARGYAFLAIGYFGAKGTADTLDRIPVDAVHEAIAAAARHPQIDGQRIAIVGGSRGGDLALLLGSYYKDISCVVAIVPSQAVFPGHTAHFSTPCWSYQGKDLPFVPLNEEAVGYLMQRNLRMTFSAMLKDTAAAEKAAIPVENLHGPVLLLSAKADEIAPTTPMCDYMMNRMRRHGFSYHTEHLAVDGSHTAPLNRFDAVFRFLDVYFPVHRPTK